MSLVDTTLDDFALKTPPGEAALERIRLNWDHWQQNAEQFGADHTASWGDRGAVELEVANLLKHLHPGGKWLDAGCANGYTTFRALAAEPNEVRAFDYSPAMIAQARATQDRFDPDGLITFSHGNILDIDQPDNTFHQAYAVRVLINLPSWEAQQQAIREMHRVLAHGGRYILSEAFEGSQERLNELRALANLPPLQAPSFNLYFFEEQLENFLPELFEIECVERFSSVYYVASRFLRELAIDPDAPPSYDHPINRLAASLETTARSGDFGVQKAYVLRKKG